MKLTKSTIFPGYFQFKGNNFAHYDLANAEVYPDFKGMVFASYKTKDCNCKQECDCDFIDDTAHIKYEIMDMLEDISETAYKSYLLKTMFN